MFFFYFKRNVTSLLFFQTMLTKGKGTDWILKLYFNKVHTYISLLINHSHCGRDLWAATSEYSMTWRHHSRPHCKESFWYTIPFILQIVTLSSFILTWTKPWPKSVWPSSIAIIQTLQKDSTNWGYTFRCSLYLGVSRICLSNLLLFLSVLIYVMQLAISPVRICYLTLLLE